MAVRREVRCHWCVHWTPAGGYCRDCGAEVVDEALFGAARMLKDAGVDRFSIPAQLAAMDAPQRDNFSRIYQRHWIALARHVDEVRELQRVLFHQSFADVLEERLIGELPWPDEQLRRYGVAAPTPGDDLAAHAREIERTTPFDQTRVLALLARVRLDDMSAVTPAAAALGDIDPVVRAETALVLSGWRVRIAFGRVDDIVAGGRNALVNELNASPFVAAAAVRRAAITGEDLPATIGVDPSDRDVWMAAALLRGDIDSLEAALAGDPLERLAAAEALAGRGHVRRLGEVLRDARDHERGVILGSLAHARRTVPDLHDVLLHIVETTADDSVRELAVRVLCPSIKPDAALRVAAAANGDRRIFQSLLQRAELPPAATADLLDWMITNGVFAMSQFGMSALAESTRLGDTFVPTRFDSAPDAVRPDLLGLAELQLAQRGDEALHAFVLGVVFGPRDGELRATAWWVLHRWYRHLGEYRGEGPFRLEQASIERFFGSVDRFLPALIGVLADDVALREVGFFEFVAHLLGTADDAFVADVQRRDRVGRELVEVLSVAINRDYWAYTMEAMCTLLSRIAVVPAWRPTALAALQSLDRTGNYHVDKAVERLQTA